jgi:hypothetical protein
MSAEALAGELHLPLFTIRLEGMITRYNHARAPDQGDHKNLAAMSLLRSEGRKIQTTGNYDAVRLFSPALFRERRRRGTVAAAAPCDDQNQLACSIANPLPAHVVLRALSKASCNNRASRNELFLHGCLLSVVIERRIDC